MKHDFLGQFTVQPWIASRLEKAETILDCAIAAGTLMRHADPEGVDLPADPLARAEALAEPVRRVLAWANDQPSHWHYEVARAAIFRCEALLERASELYPGLLEPWLEERDDLSSALAVLRGEAKDVLAQALLTLDTEAERVVKGTSWWGKWELQSTQLHRALTEEPVLPWWADAALT